MSLEASHEMGRQFFASQDRLKGGPDPALCAPDYTAQIGANPPMPHAGHEQFATLFYRAFPDLYHTVDETIAEGDRVVVRFTLRGTQSGEFMGVPATGKPIDVSAIAILRIVDGRVSHLRGVFDQAGMMHQLGVG